MSREIKIGDRSGARKPIDSGLPWDLCPSIGSTPSVVSPLLNRLRGGFYSDHDSLLQIGNERRGFSDEASGEFIFNPLIPIRTEVIGRFTAQAEGALPSGCMG